jgi:N-acetylglucosaminyldiphosphoundecaprenol N-acetyl-beta-D-mannosaminyltransferase
LSKRLGASEKFLGLSFSPVRFDELLEQILSRPAKAAFAYLVTPNVDHLVRLHSRDLLAREQVWAAYQGAAWCTCDSQILRRLAKWNGRSLPLVRGSDLTAALISRLDPGATVTIVGGDETLTDSLARFQPGLVVRQHRPPMGLRQNPRAFNEAVDFVVAQGSQFTFLAVGSPQQELLAHEISRRSGAVGVALCIGAALDFLSGAQRRAPAFLQHAGLEWLFRLANDPKRLWRRYLVEGPRILPIWWRNR